MQVMRGIEGEREVRRAATTWCAAVCIVLCTSLGYVGPAAAQADGEFNEAIVDATAVDARFALKDAWADWRTAETAGEENARRAALERAREAFYDSGENSLPVYALSLIRAAAEARDDGRDEHAQFLLEQARIFAPHHPAPFAQSMAVAFRNGQVEEGVRYALRTLALGARTFSVSAPLLVNAGLILAAALAVCVIVYGAVLIGRYGRLMLHEGHHIFPPSLAGSNRFLIGAVIVLAPALFGLSLIGTGFVWILLTVAFQRRRERVISGVLGLVILVAPLLMHQVGNILAALSDPVFATIVRINEGRGTPADAERLREYVETTDDLEAILTCALMKKRDGQYDAAMEMYQRADRITRGPLPVWAYNNWAGLHIVRGEYDEALQVLEQGLARDPDHVTLLYNLAQAYQSNIQVEEGEEAFQAARRVDAETVLHYDERKGMTPNRTSVDMAVSPTSLWTRALNPPETAGRPEVDGWALAQQAAAERFALLPLGAFPFAAIVYWGFLGMAAFFGGRGNFAAPCTRCGRPVCPRCDRTYLDSFKKTLDPKKITTTVAARKETAGPRMPEIGTICSQCYNIFYKPAGVDSTVRHVRQLEVRQHRQRQGFIAQFLTFLVPGSGHVYLGFPLGGIALMVPAALALLTLVFHYGTTRPPVYSGSGDEIIGLLFLGAFYILLLGFAEWRCSRRLAP